MKKKPKKYRKITNTALGYGRKEMYKTFQMDHKIFVIVEKTEW